MRLMHGWAADSVDSPPPCGEGQGVEVGVVGRASHRNYDPLPTPPPQGGREQAEFVAYLDFTSTFCRESDDGSDVAGGAGVGAVVRHLHRRWARRYQWRR